MNSYVTGCSTGHTITIERTQFNLKILYDYTNERILLLQKYIVNKPTVVNTYQVTTPIYFYSFRLLMLSDNKIRINDY